MLLLQLNLQAGATAYTLSGATGAYSLSGQAGTFRVGRLLSGSAGAYSLTGNVGAFKVGRALAGAVGTYSLTGNAGALTYTPGAGPVAYSLPGAVGAYSLAGNAAGFKVGRALSGEVGVYSLAGGSGTFSYVAGTPGAVAYSLSGGSGQYVLAGSDSVFAFSGQTTGGGGYGENRKRRFIQEVNGKLVIYTRASDALAALEAENAEEAPEMVAETQEKPEAVIPEPVQTVSIEEIRAQAAKYDAERRVMELFHQRRLEEILALYEALLERQEEDEIELLLLAS